MNPNDSLHMVLDHQESMRHEARMVRIARGARLRRRWHRRTELDGTAIGFDPDVAS